MCFLNIWSYVPLVVPINFQPNKWKKKLSSWTVKESLDYIWILEYMNWMNYLFWYPSPSYCGLCQSNSFGYVFIGRVLSSKSSDNLFMIIFPFGDEEDVVLSDLDSLMASKVHKYEIRSCFFCAASRKYCCWWCQWRKVDLLWFWNDGKVLSNPLLAICN